MRAIFIIRSWPMIKEFLYVEFIICQCCPHLETSQLICTANQLTGFYKGNTDI